MLDGASRVPPGIRRDSFQPVFPPTPMATLLQRRSADLDTLRREMDTLVQSFFPDASTSAGWTPRADVVEAEDRYHLALDLPGVSRESLDVTVHDGTLKVSGERVVPDGYREARFHRVERAHGRFARTFRLGPDVDPDSVEATLADGVLTVTVRKAEQARPRRIEIASPRAELAETLSVSEN